MIFFVSIDSDFNVVTINLYLVPTIIQTLHLFTDIYLLEVSVCDMPDLCSVHHCVISQSRAPLIVTPSLAPAEQSSVHQNENYSLLTCCKILAG